MSESPLGSHFIQMNFPKIPNNSKSNTFLMNAQPFSFKSPSHFGSSNIKKIRKMRSLILSRKIMIFKRLYEKNITNSHLILINYEIYNCFNAFCASFQSNSTLISLNFSSMIIDPLLMIRLVKSLENHPSLKKLDLSNNTLTSLSYKYLFRALKRNKKIESLNFFNDAIYNENFRDLNDLLKFNKKIKEINFNFALMESEGLKIYFDTLAHTSNIKSVKLANKTLNYSALVALSYYLSKSPKPKLEELDLSFCKISGRELQIMMKTMPNSSFCRKKRNIYPEIHNLLLGGNKINGKNSIDLFNEFLKKIDAISSLDLSKNSITALDLIFLANSFMKISFSLNLSHNRFQENFPEKICFFRHLKVLNLSFNNLTENSIEIIANTLAFNPNWHTLNLSNNAIGNKDMKTLINGLENNTNLQVLNVSFNEITDKGLEDFRIISSRLREINLSNNDIGIFGLTYLFSNERKTEVFLKKVLLENIHYYDESYSKESREINLELKMKFLEELSVENSLFIADFLMKSLNYAENLIELNLNDSIPEGNIQQLSQFLMNSSTLTTLKMRNCGLGGLKTTEINELFKGYRNCQQLSLLDVSKNKLGNYLKEFIENAQEMKSLKSLNLSSNLLENDHAIYISELITQNSLETLDLSNNLFSYKAFESLSSALMNNISIRTLKLGKMHLDILCLIPLGKVLSETACLENLDLSETVFNTASILELNRKEKGALKELSFNYMKFDSFQYSILINMMILNPFISHVNLEACLFIRLSLNRLIKCVCNLDGLTLLNLSNISFTDGEISELFMRLRKHVILDELILRNLDFREKSIKGLGKFLRKNNSVKTLDLSMNNLSKAFFIELKSSMLENSKIQHLKLNSCLIKDDNFRILLEILQSSQSIKSIELSKNLLTFDSLFLLFSKEFSYKSNLLERILLDSNPFTFNEGISVVKTLDFNRISELNLMKALKGTTHELLKAFVKFLSKDKGLLSLNLNENGLNDDILAILSDSFLRNSALNFLSIANNRFSLIGISLLFTNIKANSSLIYIDISENVKNPYEGKIFCEDLQESLLVNKTLQIIDISKNFTDNSINPLIKAICINKKNLIFLNENWHGIKSTMAIKVIESYQNFFKNLTGNDARIEVLTENKKFHRLDFSKSQLDDDFCLFFSDNIHKMPFLEEFFFSENYNITLSGLKNIYVGLILHKESTHLDKIYFDKINTKIFLNNGIAASIAEWGKYGEETSRMKKILQKFSYGFFSKLITFNNKYQFCDQFSEFTDIFKKSWILLFFLLNFIIMITLSLALPIASAMSCGRGHAYYSHIVYSIYVFLTIIIEFSFWILCKKKLRDYSENEKNLKREVFISDVLFLLSSAGEKFNLYLDVCFITISSSCEELAVSRASIAIVVIKFFISTVMALKAMGKLCIAIHKENKVAILNLITKLALIEYFFLIGDILDRYVPGNVKRFKRILGFKLRRSIFISTNILLAGLKFFLEDLPQSIIQCYYIFSLQEKRNYDNDWIILINIAKNFISLIVSFYATVSLRPSYIEQVDFDERISVYRLIHKKGGKVGERRSRRATSLLLENFQRNTLDEEIQKLSMSFHDKGIKESVGFGDRKLKAFFEIGRNVVQSKSNTFGFFVDFFFFFLSLIEIFSSNLI